MTPSGKTFPFLSLPAELRHQIYETAFVYPWDIDATIQQCPPQQLLIPTAFLQVCRQVHREAHGILYAQNTFHVGNGPDGATMGTTWLSSIGTNAGFIRSVTVCIYRRNRRYTVLPFFVFLSELRNVAVNLDRLCILLGPHIELSNNKLLLLMHELQRFKNLKALSIHGTFDIWWADTLKTTLVHCNLVITGSGSQKWRQYQQDRAFWLDNIQREADRILRQRLHTQIYAGSRSNTEELSELYKAQRDAWTHRCMCVECKEKMAATIPEDEKLILSSRADGEKEQRGRDCKCRDCTWVLEHGTEAQKRMLMS